MLLDVLYEDEALIAVHKPAGLLVHRSALARRETLFAMQLVRDQIGQHVYPVHRLDRPTSGVLLFAKSSVVAHLLCQQFQNQQVDKVYYAIVRGYLTQTDTLDYPLQEELDKIADKQAKIDKAAQEAITFYQGCAQVELPFAVGRYPTTRYSLVRLEPKTGRKHQLRRHLAHLRHPIVGDTTHGDGKHNRFFREQFESSRLLLIAKSISFMHPLEKKQQVIQTEFDETFIQLAAQFNWHLPSSK
tara:strand:- start:3441 stop:4172 length:732 start_codon:yes stop_codon:yes gene_type:complete